MLPPILGPALRAFVRIISYPSHSNRACPICDVNSLNSSLLAHTLSNHVDTSNDVTDILDSLWASASIPASNLNAQDSDHDTSSTSSIDSMNITNASSTIDPDLSSSNSDSDTDFLNIVYPLHVFILVIAAVVTVSCIVIFIPLYKYPTCMCYAL